MNIMSETRSLLSSAHQEWVDEVVSTLSAMGAAGYKDIDDHTLHAAISVINGKNV